MAVNFPDSPSDGATHTVSGVTYTYSSSDARWEGGDSTQPLTVGADSGTDDLLTLGTDTLNIVGTSNEVETAVTNNTITIGLPNNITVGGTLGITGAVTANAGVVVDNITIDGTTIALSSGDLTLDVAGDIILDSDGKDIILKDGGTEFGRLKTSSTPDHFYIKSAISNNDLIFQGVDGGSSITALTLDMSEAGAAIFNSNITIPATSKVYLDGGGDTFIQETAANTITFTAGNTERLRIDGSTGRIGIGTTSPSHLLTLESATSPAIQLKDTTNNAALLAYAQDSDVRIGASSNHPLLLLANNVEKLKANTDGTLVINQAYTLPAAAGSSGQVLKLPSSGTVLEWGAAPASAIEVVRQYGAIIVANGTDRWYPAAATTVSKIVARIATAPTGAALSIRINKVSGGSTTTTTMSITAGSNKAENTSPSLTLSYDDYITVDVTQIGSSEAGRDLQVIFTYTL